MAVSKRRSPAVVAISVVAALAVVGAVAGYALSRGAGDDPDERDPSRPGVDVADPAVVTADRFAAAISTGRYQGVQTADPAETEATVAEKVQFTYAGLAAAGTPRPEVEVVDVSHTPGEQGDTAQARVHFEWEFPGGRVWGYDTNWLLVEQTATPTRPAGWRVSFDPAMLLASHDGGHIVRAVRTPSTRGRILDTTGRSLTPGGGTVTVGIRKSRTADPEATARQVAALTGVDAAELVARVAAASPEDFVEVITLERGAYDLIRAQIQPMPGTVFTEQSAQSDLPASFARGVLGTTGPATAELVAASEGRLTEGDTTGLSGIQQARDTELAGRPGLRIESVPTSGSGAPTVLKDFPAEPGQDVTVTLDAAVQIAADATAAVSPQPVALVAVRVSTGDVLAVANGPAGYNRAFLNRYPPGSTFKVVTALAYLQGGLLPDDTVGCPATIVAGKRFKNAGEFALGDVPFHRAFARSCNTTFVGRSDTVTAQTLTDTAALLGFRDLDAELGMDVFGGSVPLSEDETLHAANSIGQGKVEASALTVALMAASVANGTSLSPRLFVAAGATPPAARPALPEGPIAALRAMMREVVTDGTGSALDGSPGGPVHAKTGTAEFGNEDPPQSHAWIAGYQGDIAFAVVVEEGGGGGAVAGPVAAQFLRELADG